MPSAARQSGLVEQFVEHLLASPGRLVINRSSVEERLGRVVQQANELLAKKDAEMREQVQQRDAAGPAQGCGPDAPAVPRRWGRAAGRARAKAWARG